MGQLTLTRNFGSVIKYLLNVFQLVIKVAFPLNVIDAVIFLVVSFLQQKAFLEHNLGVHMLFTKDALTKKIYVLYVSVFEEGERTVIKNCKGCSYR